MLIPTNIDLSKIKLPIDTSFIALKIFFDSTQLELKEKLWLYDFNSLYPYILAILPMPAGKVSHFTGDIYAFNKNPIGFFKANIVCPENIDEPVLYIKREISGKEILFAPKGKFTGWLFSKELENAKENFGYTFRVLEGYYYKKEVVLFKNFITSLYNLRMSYSKMMLEML